MVCLEVDTRKTRSNIISGERILETAALYGRSVAQVVRRRLPPRRPVLQPTSSHVGFVMDREALGQVFSQYFGFPATHSF
jgi:hypothetical protein